jgi:carboxyl-terminal processing protease
MSYIDRNRNDLQKKYPTFKEFDEHYFVSDDLMDDLLNRTKEDRISGKRDSANVPNDTLEIGLTRKDMEEFHRSEPFLKVQLKALIARGLWNMYKYFQVINQTNDSYNKALGIIRDEKWYNRLLKGK